MNRTAVVNAFYALQTGQHCTVEKLRDHTNIGVWVVFSYLGINMKIIHMLLQYDEMNVLHWREADDGLHRPVEKRMAAQLDQGFRHGKADLLKTCSAATHRHN